MSYASQFSPSVLPLGALVQGINLSEPQYVRCDGLPRARASFPRLSTLFTFGALTGTVRTLAQSGGGAQAPIVVATADHFVATSAQAGNSIQHSADGVSWATASTAPSSSISGLIATPFRFIALNAYSSSSSQPFATTNLTPSGTWSATTNGPTAVPTGNHISRMAYSPTLARVLLAAGGTAARYTLEDAATAWVARTSTTGMGAAVGACWTGTRFVLIAAGTQTCEYTTDGATYTAGLLAEATSASQGNIASDGSGTVVVSGCPSGLQVSRDHGATWAIVQIPGVAPSDTWRVQRMGDRFVVPTAQGLAFSMYGEVWQPETTPLQAMVTTSAVAKKGSVLVQIQGGTTAYSFTESATHFNAPRLAQSSPSPYGVTYIKAT